MWNTKICLSLLVLPPHSLAFAPQRCLQQTPSRRQPTHLSATAVSARGKRIGPLRTWIDTADIKLGGIHIEESVLGGIGLSASQDIPADSVLLTVPSNVALSVECPGEGPDNRDVLKLVEDRRILREAPWFTQFAVYLYGLTNVSSIRQDLNMQAWVDSLPAKFDTPIHWTESQLDAMQYNHMKESVARQETEWKSIYEKFMSVATPDLRSMSFDQFVWGCENARSRAFSGAYQGSAFNPLIYAFTLLLVTVYVGLGMGTLEQAANGAGLVFCASVFKDFVLPKLSKSKRYVICPVIDMANHRSLRASGEVSFEFFGDAYSLASSGTIPKGDEVFISYGSRSNDQLLQYYGFIEVDNPHDVYVMPPLREWDIDALEEACGRRFSTDKLQKLDRAGLLGSTFGAAASDDDGAANPFGGVVVTRAEGLDPAVLQALRALVASDAEWDAAGEAIGNFAAQQSPENERLANLVAKTALQLELDAKPTTLDQDRELLKRMKASRSTDTDEELAVLFRIEKKKLLLETIDKMY